MGIFAILQIKPISISRFIFYLIVSRHKQKSAVSVKIFVMQDEQKHKSEKKHNDYEKYDIIAT